MSARMVYAILRGRRTVVHLAPDKFQAPICGRPADMTSNMPGGKRLCLDCRRLVEVPA